MKALAISVVIVVAFSGCGGCGSSEEPPSGRAAAPPEAAEAASPAQPPIAPAPEQPAPANVEEEEDCFVIIDATPDYGPAPLEVEFSAEVDCTAGDPTYVWNFGDGSPVSNEPSPKHTYQKPGEYTAALVITGPRGGTDEDEIDILVEE